MTNKLYNNNKLILKFEKNKQMVIHIYNIIINGIWVSDFNIG